MELSVSTAPAPLTNCPSQPCPSTAAWVQVLLVAELEELQANPQRPARGTVLEASLDKKAGAVCSLLVGTGTLRIGDAVQAGSAFGKVRRCGGGRCSGWVGEEKLWLPGRELSLGCGLSTFPAVDQSTTFHPPIVNDPPPHPIPAHHAGQGHARRGGRGGRGGALDRGADAGPVQRAAGRRRVHCVCKRGRGARRWCVNGKGGRPGRGGARVSGGISYPQPAGSSTCWLVCMLTTPPSAPCPRSRGD